MLPDDVTVFAGPRGSGRTTALINWAMFNQTERAIVVRDSREYTNVIHVFKEANQGIAPAQVGLHIWINDLLWGVTEDIGVDNYDTFANAMTSLHVPLDRIKAVTIESDQYTNIPCRMAVAEIIASLQEIELDLR